MVHHKCCTVQYREFARQMASHLEITWEANPTIRSFTRCLTGLQGRVTDWVWQNIDTATLFTTKMEVNTPLLEGRKLLKASKTAKNKEYFPFSPSPNDVVYDYTASGVRRSIEDSLQRLGMDSLDTSSCTTSRRITNICHHPGRNNSRSLGRAHFLS
jgi:hypothetical protein